MTDECCICMDAIADAPMDCHRVVCVECWSRICICPICRRPFKDQQPITQPITPIGLCLLVLASAALVWSIIYLFALVNVVFYENSFIADGDTHNTVVVWCASVVIAWVILYLIEFHLESED